MKLKDKPKQKHDIAISIHLTKNEYEKIKDGAQKSNVTMSQYIRNNFNKATIHIYDFKDTYMLLKECTSLLSKIKEQGLKDNFSIIEYKKVRSLLSQIYTLIYAEVTKWQ